MKIVTRFIQNKIMMSCVMEILLLNFNILVIPAETQGLSEFKYEESG